MNSKRCRPGRIVSWLVLGFSFIVGALSEATPAAADACEEEQPNLRAERVQALVPELEAYISAGMQAFDLTGAAVGIVTGDKLVYAKGFGLGRKGGTPVNTRTVFQIGSTTKAFLATTMAITVDRGKFRWDDRVIDLYPSFQLNDPWVTREFRVFDLLAQRSGLPPYVNDGLTFLGYRGAELIRSLRNVEPVSSFRSSFAYVNILHLLAGSIVASVRGEPDWNAVARQDLLEPLGMMETSFTAQAIEAAPNHAVGYRWTPQATVEVPFETAFPYALGPAGNLNSTVEDTARWLRLQLRDGMFEGPRLLSPENLAVTRTAKIAMSDSMSYALGWVLWQTPGGRVIWHNGGTTGFGAHIGFLPDKDVGVIVLSNQGNQGFPDALAKWVYDRMCGNRPIDHMANALETARSNYAAEEALYRRPADAKPSPLGAVLTGAFVSSPLGKATLRAEGDRLVLELENTGAQLGLEPFDGDVFTVRLLPQGRFARSAQLLGDRPLGFAEFQVNDKGKRSTLSWSSEGQTYIFRRE